MTSRNPGKLRPLASAVRIVPLTAAALAGNMASGATIPVTDTSGFSTIDSCSIVDAVESINAVSLQAACTLSGAEPFGVNDTVDLTGFSDPTTITFANLSSDTALTFFRSATIHGNLDSGGQPLVTLARDTTSTLFRLIKANAGLTVNGLALTGGDLPGKPGGAITVNAIAALTLTNAVVTGNSALAGGAIYANTGVSVSNSIVSGNYAQNLGGGIACLFACSSVSISNSIVSDNETGHGNGGGVYSRSNVIATGSIISGNSAAQSGGGIYARSRVDLSNSTVSGNFARNNGGGVYSKTVTASHTMLDNNYSNGNGGAIFAGNTVTITYSTIDSNRAAQAGGGIASSSSASIIQSTITGNSAQTSGGGVSTINITTDNSTFNGNSTHAYGGGIYASANASLVSTTISSNHFIGALNNQGAGVFIGNATAFISGTLVFGNTGGTDFGGFSGPISGDHNLVGTSGLSILLPGDTLHCDPHLGPLADNGGPTQTQALPYGSCAIDAGPLVGDLPNDQRGDGYTRTIGTATDIGAFEVQIVDKIFKDGFDG